MNAVHVVLKNFVPEAIVNGNNCYQEFLRGTSKEDTYVPLAGRMVVLLSCALVSGLQAATETGHHLIIAQIALSMFVIPGLLTSYGAKRGYNVNFGREIKVLHYSKLLTTVAVPFLVKNLVKKQKDERRVKFVLNILISMGTTYFLYKYQSERNGIPLKPYLLWALGGALALRVKTYQFDSRIDKELEQKGVPCPSRINIVVSRVLVMFCMAQIVKVATKEPIKVAWKWEILSLAAAHTAAALLK